MKYLLCALSLLACYVCQSQSVKDYFFPNQAYNRTDYNIASDRSFKSTTFYLNEDGKQYVIYSYFVKNDYGYRVADKLAETITVLNNSIVSSKSQYLFQGHVKETNHYLGKKLITLPPKGKTDEWDFVDVEDITRHAIISWSNETMNGYAILLKTVDMGAQIHREYYVYGIGLWRKDFGVKNNSDVLFMPYLEFDKLSFMPNEDK